MSGKFFQDKAHCEKEEWSNLAKWSSLGVAAGGLTVHSEREPSFPLSNLESSTSPFSSSRDNGEESSFHSSVDSSNAICISNLMIKSSLDKVFENQDTSADCLRNGHKETIKIDNRNPENMYSYIPFWSSDKSKYSASASAGDIYSPPKIVSNVFQSNVAPEVVVSRNPLSSVSKKIKAVVFPNQEKTSENLLFSATKSSYSRLTSPSKASHSQGLIHRIHKNGLPYYTFSLNESYQVMVAKTWKANSSDREDIEWIYTFHSSHGNKKTSKKNRWVSSVIEENTALDLVGWMRVSSSAKPPFESLITSQHNVQTEFVLFSASAEIEPANETPTKAEEKNISSPDQSFRSTTSSGNSPVLSSTSDTSLLPGSTLLLQMPFPDSIMQLREMKKSKSDHSRQSSFKPQSVDENAATQENCFNSEMPELAAIVICTPSSQSQSIKGRNEKDVVSKDSGGWGLKFLEKYQKISVSRNLHRSNNLVSASTPSRQRCKIDEPGERLICVEKYQKISVTAIVPADVHGLPLTNSTRPSSLIERWRFDGKCDCGGWDIGCPITVLHGQKQKGNEFIMPGPISDLSNSSFFLFKGGKQKSPAFTIEPVDEGLHILTFQPQLSAIQAFSICVALLHVGDPVMNDSRKPLIDTSSSFTSGRS